jgi:glycosyltransferase involved in cell wall biosynthesis
MEISIIICTRNRAESLRQTLRSLAACAVPADLTAELLVIDNGSTDGTREIVSGAKVPRLSLRYVAEPRPGQCHARNSGLAHSAGDVILFTDDDVRPPVDWIEGMCRPILNGEADAVAGGVVFPPGLRMPGDGDPGWMASTEAIDPVCPNRFVGANMAFHSRVLDRVPAFDVELGPGALGFTDETLFSWQLAEAGYRIAGRLDVPVEHHFDPSRLSREALLATAAGMGRSEAYVDYHWAHNERPDGLILKLRARAGLFARRLLRWQNCYRRQCVMWWELKRVRATAYLAHLAHERKRPRNYDKRGLRKHRGTLWAPAPESLVRENRAYAEAFR